MKILEYLYNKIHGEIPYYARYSIGLIIWKPIRKFINVVIIPNIPLNWVRICLYRLVGYKIGKKTFIGMKCYLDDMDPHMLTIEDNVTISYGCYFASHGRRQMHTPINIKSGTFIGARSLLLSGKHGITIGKNAIIGGGSVVTQSVPDNAVAVGNPAKVK